MKRPFVTSLLLLLIVALTGCLYPKERLQQNRISTGEYIVLVQHAVETYRQRTGVLPIRNSTSDTPLYEKYVIDFKKLLDYNIISRVPADAYEAGGNYYYVIVDPEGDMRIKLMDLVTAGKVADLQRLVHSFQAKEHKLPLGDPVQPQFYYPDYERLGVRAEQLRSVYSPLLLSPLIHESGRIVVDYAPEIMIALNKQGTTSPDPGIDLRRYLVEQSFYIPVNSSPYYWQDGEPVITEEISR